MQENNSFKILKHNYELSFKLQQDEIDDLIRKETLSEKVFYEQGFREGVRHAMILSMNNENVVNYADGYHAAIDQFEFNSTTR